MTTNYTSPSNHAVEITLRPLATLDRYRYEVRLHGELCGRASTELEAQAMAKRYRLEVSVDSGDGGS